MSCLTQSCMSNGGAQGQSARTPAISYASLLLTGRLSHAAGSCHPFFFFDQPLLRLMQELSRQARGLLQGEHPAPAAGAPGQAASPAQASPEEEAFDHSFYVFGGYQVGNCVHANLQRISCFSTVSVCILFKGLDCSSMRLLARPGPPLRRRHRESVKRD